METAIWRILQHLAGRIPTGVPEHYRPLVAWNAEQLTKHQRSALDSWPKGLDRTMHALGDVLFCHATPRNATEIFTRLTPEAHLLSTAFMGIDANLVICGHTHMQFDRTVGKTRVVNAGSVGMPFGEPGAYWLLLENDVELRYTHYDLEEAARVVCETTYPQAQEFAQRNILNPPSEAEMLEAFSRAELK